MEKTTKTLKEIVVDYITEYPALRDNDNMLIARIMKEVFNVTDFYDLALKTDKCVYASIVRYRAKAQEENPLLASSKEVQKAREEYEEKVREAMRGV